MLKVNNEDTRTTSRWNILGKQLMPVFKVNNRNTTKKCKTCSKLTTTPEHVKMECFAKMV